MFHVHGKLKSFERYFDCFAWARGRKLSSDASRENVNSIIFNNNIRYDLISLACYLKVLRIWRLPSAWANIIVNNKYEEVYRIPRVKRKMRFYGLSNLFTVFEALLKLINIHISCFQCSLVIAAHFSVFVFVVLLFSFYCRHAAVFTLFARLFFSHFVRFL